MPNHYMTLSKGIDSDSQHFGNHRLMKKHKTRLALGTLLLLLIGMGITAQAQTQTISPTPQVKGMHIENVYIPPGSDDDQQILIIGELVCESAIGVTKTKDWRQETPPYGFDFDGDGVFDNGEHIYETDDHFTGVRTPIARVDTMPVAPKNWAFKSFQKFIFFDDKDLYSVWSFNYSKTNSNDTKAYSNQKDYFVETWRSYADTSDMHYDTISSSNTSNVFVAIKSAPGFSHMARLVNNGESHANTWFNLTTTINLKDHYWEPVGFGDLGDNCGINPQFDGKFDGRGHFIDSALTILPVTCMGMFGDLGSTGKIIRTFDYDCNFTYTFPELNPAVQGHLGGIVGRIQAGGEVDGCEAAVDTVARYNGAGNVNSGGIAGSNLGTIRNSFAVDSKIGGTFVGGLAGSNSGTVANAYTKRVSFEGTPTNEAIVGVLVGINGTNGSLTNAYTDATSGAIVGSGTAGSNVYAAAAVDGATAAYTATNGSNHLGYMWYDNVIIGEQAPLFETLNANKDNADFTWARPALACEEASSTTKPINDDLPVLLLCESHKRELTEAGSYTSSTAYQGGFRAVGTRGGAGNVLQYGGPDRDVNAVNTALTRGYEANASNTNKDYLFIYGDIATDSEAPTSACSTYTQKKVSIYEHAAINSPGTLADFEETYVGVTFETAGGGTADTLNNNHPNLVTETGGFALQRSWHLFSTPLREAPLGFNYQGHTNINSYWTNLDGEFSWLEGNPNGTSDGFGARRYWMGDEDGYFPKNVDHDIMFPPKGPGNNYDYLFIVKQMNGNTVVQPSDECPVSGSYRYPYGMDFYSWEEDCYHYINFKRNPRNHWHTDVDPTTGEHEQIPYPNEDNLRRGKGYMAAIHAKTLLQSHGCLNNANVGRDITKQPSYPIRMVPGWNLIGNPYHGYLNLADFKEDEGNLDLLESIMVYVNANYIDAREGGWEGNDYTGFLYCAPGSSRGSRTVSWLHPHQGFYVKVKEKKKNDGTPIFISGTANFNMGMLDNRATVGNSGGYRNDDMQPAYPLVNLYLSSDKGCSDVTVVEFNRPEWGGALKMRDMRIGNGLFYTSHGEENYGVLFATPEAERIPLRFEPKEEGNGDTYTISWETANGDFSKLILVDNMTGVQYDMLRNSSYSFNGKMGDYYMRFYITFEVTGLDEEQDEDDDASTGTASTTFTFFDGSQWVVTNDGHSTATLDLIDLQGRVLHSTTVAEGQARIGLPDVSKGMYLMRMTNQKGVFVQKIVVR